jgi:hypothetical protein
MLSRRADAFEDAASNEAVKRGAQYERARAVLDEQADALMDPEAADANDAPAQHAPYNPHRRRLSSAALRLIRAHQKAEEAAQE